MKIAKQLLEKVKKLFTRLTDFFPSPLPVGMQAFEKWSASIISVYDLPNNDSVKFALAAQIMHLGSTDFYKPRRYFGLSLLKGSANQIAHAVMLDLKEKQAKEEAERVAAEKLAKDENKLQAVPDPAS